MSLAQLAGSAEVQAVAGALLHFLWQGTLIAATLWLVLAVLPGAQASTRYAACAGALLALLLAPALTLWLLLGPRQPHLLVAWAEPELPPASSYFFLLLLSAWALGTVLMTARLALGVVRLRGLVRRAAPAPQRWQRALDALAARLGLRQRVQLLASDQVDAPLVLGWLRPVVLIPLAALTQLPSASVEALLAHELGHVRRLDYLVNVVQSSVEALLFYHPAVHWVSRCMRFEREHCCDDIAIQVSGSSLRYARALTEMETLRLRIPEPALSSKGGSLMHRIERILRPPARTAAAPRVALTASIVIASAFALSVAGVWACSGSAAEEPMAPVDAVDSAAPTTERALSSDAALSTRPSLAAPGAAATLPAWLPPRLLRWQPALADTAQRYGLDPALLAIVTLVESLGDPAARSPRGAVGLMQLMPATAAKIAAERQLRGYSEERLLEPAYNMDLGAWYLSRQLAALGSIELAAVAYNAGPRLLREHLERGAPLPRETERYRDLVVGMWQERESSQSPTYTAWRQQLAQPEP